MSRCFFIITGGLRRKGRGCGKGGFAPSTPTTFEKVDETFILVS